MSDIWEYVSTDLEFIIDSVVIMRHYTKLEELDDYETIEDYVTDHMRHGDVEDVDINSVECDFVSRHSHNQKLQEIRETNNNKIREMKDDRNRKLEEQKEMINTLNATIEELQKKLKFIGGGEE